MGNNMMAPLKFNTAPNASAQIRLDIQNFPSSHKQKTPRMWGLML